VSGPTRKETITRSAEATFVHKKVSDGGGEFAFVTLRLEPLPRGAGEQFLNVAPAVPPEFVVAIGSTIHDGARTGGTFGLPVVDFKVTLLDVRYHEIDSNARTLSIAADGAFRKALQDAGSIGLPT
jgi:elongation factor G